MPYAFAYSWSKINLMSFGFALLIVFFCIFAFLLPSNYTVIMEMRRQQFKVMENAAFIA